MRKFSKVTKIALLTVCAVSLIAAPSVSAKQWFFGLGTGFTFGNTEGDQGLHTALFGPIQAEIDLDPSDFQDLMETGFGLGGYATDGTWIIQYSFGMMKLGDEPNGSLPVDAGGGTFAADLFFKMTTGQLTVGNTVYRSKDFKFSFTPYAGVRYLKHEIGSDIVVTQGATTITIVGSAEHNWTDVLIGSSIGYVLSPKWTWNTQADAGFGGSEGTYSFKTSLSWKALSHWTLAPNFSYSAIEFENGTKGDTDWYFYDANEFGMGIGIMYSF